MTRLGTIFLIAIAFGSVALAEPAPSGSGIFFDVDIDLAADGSGTVRLSYPSNPVMNPKTERDRFSSPTTEMQQVEFNGMFVRATVAFQDLTRVHEAPELRMITAKREQLPDGRDRVEARLRSYLNDKVTIQAPLTITVKFPGAVTDANTKEIKGTTATWRAPVADFFTEAGVSLEAVYRRPEADAVAKPVVN
jgi:hypothetical protein